MRNTLIVLFLIAMLISSTQTFRHFYVKFIQPTGSVLDQFKTETESEIDKAESLDDLLALYRQTKDEIKKYESDENNPKIEHRQRNNVEPYKSEIQVKEEIRSREYDQNQLFKLWFFWIGGLLSTFIGIIAFKKINKWLGLSGIIVGFSEMLCWTSPLFHNRLLSQQYEYLLNYKLLFSIVTLIILAALWLIIEKKDFLTVKG
jgi:hypothetical protein